MTEAEWLACDSPKQLLKHKGKRRRSGRKLRLFAVACCRRGWDLLVDPRSKWLLEVQELYADGFVDKETLARAVDAAATAPRDAELTRFPPAVMTAVWAVSRFQVNLRIETVATAMTIVAGWADSNAHPFTHWGDDGGDERANTSSKYWAGVRAEERAQANLYREIFVNPFRSATIDPTWLTWNGGTIPDLARAIYDEKAFDRLPILADALEEAGCADANILDHCRGSSEHVRGCWVLDALLGRA